MRCRKARFRAAVAEGSLLESSSVVRVVGLWLLVSQSDRLGVCHIKVSTRSASALIGVGVRFGYLLLLRLLIPTCRVSWGTNG